MSFFRIESRKYSSWLFIAIGLSLVAVVSTSAIAYVKNTSNPSASIPNDVVIDKVLVIKSERVLKLLSDDNVIKTYHVALGSNPIGHKQQEGDGRTPVGDYLLDYKNENSIAHRSIHVSYPNVTDTARAKALGVSPGGDIMIHGQMNGFGRLAWFNQKRDWTEGCIAVTNDEMDEIMAVVEVGTVIEIIE